VRLRLTPISADTRGIYGGRMPSRFLFLHPMAAAAFARLERVSGGLVYSDMYRSPADSLEAMNRKRGVQPPGYSGHNFGLSVDVAVDETLRARGWTYAELLRQCATQGWYCHRRDGLRGLEDWHFNWFNGSGLASRYLAKSKVSWAAPIEQLILDLFQAEFRLTALDIQKGLQKLKLYPGELDGILGPISRQAIRAFQRAWKLEESEEAGERTQRVLAVVTADREHVFSASAPAGDVGG
jgi:hypothetical protein